MTVYFDVVVEVIELFFEGTGAVVVFHTVVGRESLSDESRLAVTSRHPVIVTCQPHHNIYINQ